MISPDPIHACWEGSQVIDSDFVWPAQKYFVTQCLATLVTLLAFCVEGAEFSMAPRSSLCIRSACVAGAIF